MLIGPDADVIDTDDLGHLLQTVDLSWTPKMRQLAKVEPCP